MRNQSVHPLALGDNNSNEEFSIPTDITDILQVCREYAKLGWNVQQQIETILEVGVEQAIIDGMVSATSLPHIKDFLSKIGENPYFGDAIDQADECIYLIETFERNHPKLFATVKN